MTTNTESADTPARYAIIECGSDKHEGPLPAKDLYASTYFVLKRDWAEQFADRYWILSAEFGLIPADKEIPKYNTTLEDDDVDVDEWLATVQDQFAATDDLQDEDAELWVLASQGKLTAQAPSLETSTLREFLENAAVETRWPFDETAGIGYQMGWLSDSTAADEVAMPSQFE